MSLFRISHHGFAATCLNKSVLQEIALINGCEHACCVTCILRWAVLDLEIIEEFPFVLTMVLGMLASFYESSFLKARLSPGGAGRYRQPKKKDTTGKSTVGRHEKRALKREAADK
ncbi:hypothetical protein CDL12_18237 [Handroanthus impetiginosus]|uniref:Uncharacterized protein n=1 Tax=Handroanthus impetiginosus TaxID=429701 RepID=A0A2G9GV74_9LAMI|nr:hypothetical protein CDL12_18237 [Handroanthus impetiginosus]